MIRSALYLGLAGIVLVLVLLASHPVMQTVEGARATATPTPTLTPTVAAPAAPSGVYVIDSTLYWSDNSNNEDGFYINLITCRFTPSERSFQYQVATNTTSFVVPQEYFVACPCSAQAWTVIAYNAYGQASGTAQTGIPSCAPIFTPTPIATIAMPRTGAGGSGDFGGWWQTALLAGCALTLTGGIALFTRTKMQDRRRDS